MQEKLLVLTDDPNKEKAERWAEFLKVPCRQENTPAPGQLVFHGDETYFLDSEKRRLSIDFDKNHLDYHRKHRGKSELLAKALGLGKGVRRVLDLSVGLAVDSVFLCQLGFEVRGVERSPILYVLLSEAFARTRQTALRNYQLTFADSFEFLRTQKAEVDAIYFDPMYPHKKKSALPRQEMVVFRDLVGDDEDAGRVLEEAFQWNVSRVVVKRPLQAEELRPGVRHAFAGKTVRYDMYMR